MGKALIILKADGSAEMQDGRFCKSKKADKTKSKLARNSHDRRNIKQLRQKDGRSKRGKRTEI